MIQNPTFNAILQVVYLVGVICSILVPLSWRWPRLQGVLRAFAGLGGDPVKTGSGIAQATQHPPPIVEVPPPPAQEPK